MICFGDTLDITYSEVQESVTSHTHTLIHIRTAHSRTLTLSFTFSLTLTLTLTLTHSHTHTLSHTPMPAIVNMLNTMVTMLSTNVDWDLLSGPNQPRRSVGNLLPVCLWCVIVFI